MKFSRISSFGWKVRLNHVFPEKQKQIVRPSLMQALSLIPLFLRYIVYLVIQWYKGRRPVMNFLKMVHSQQKSGVPFGGIGGGSIGRGFKGEFWRYQMTPGIYEYNTVDANQFIVTIQNQRGRTVYQKVLSVDRQPTQGKLASWSWDYPGSAAEYTALYPRSWTKFNIVEDQITLVCRQVSPIIPHNYKDSCLPGGIFIWEIENKGDEPKYVSITFTFKNGTGGNEDGIGGVRSELFDKTQDGVSIGGVLIHQTIKDIPVTYAVSGQLKEEVSFTRSCYFDPNGYGNTIWSDLNANGELAKSEKRKHTTDKGEELACAVCSKTFVSPKAITSIEFSLVWDSPVIHFPLKGCKHVRYYTKHFGNDGKAGPAMSHYAMCNYKRWEEEIANWQQPILEDMQLPDWYKSALFNELYYVADGGSVWLLADKSEGLRQSDPRLEYGRFAYLEGHEYRMFNTYDVHFYASFALAQLWPKLQHSIQYEFRDSVFKENRSLQWQLYDGSIVHRKAKCSIPHDLGDPDEEPFTLVNSYHIHDTSEWRDLNLKFVLQCYRDYSLSGGDFALIADMWQQLCELMERSLLWDADADGLVENGGFPDQTYDSWTMTGASSYCGSLWVAAVFCMVKMAEVVGDTASGAKYDRILEKAKRAFEKKLWNGQYYNFDESRSKHSKSVMADQLCGLWYLRASNVKDEVFPSSNVRSCLETIYRLNVKGYSNGSMGAVNGIMPDGQPDSYAVQSEEVWTGVTYGLAAFMIHEGLVEMGFTTAQGIYETVYNKIGLGFETPEALLRRGTYRSVGYMRPLCIWAMQLAWKNHKHRLTT